MLCFNLIGRLGNQMFIYAYSKNYVKRHNRFYCYNYLGKLTYFKLTFRDYFLNFGFKLFFKFFIRNNKNTKFINYENCWKDYTEKELGKGNKIVQGYFQGENYFGNLKEEINSLFQIRNKYTRKFNQIFKDFFCQNKVISVHIRRGDYKNIVVHGLEYLGPIDLTVPLNYYHKIISRYKDDKSYVFYFLSDEIDFVKKEFGHLENSYFSKYEEIIDFIIIKNSNININACSTFSWWASYLNERLDKIVYVPKYFAGFLIKKEFPIHIIPKDWIQIDVYD